MKKVILYTTKTCGRCRIIKDWLRQTNISFEERDLGDSEVMTELVMRNIVVMSAPAIEIKGIVYTKNQIFENNGLINPSFKKNLEAS